MSKRDKPDEAFEIPGLRMERRGRFTTVKTNRTQAQHRELIKRVVESRPKLLEQIEKDTAQLLGIVHKFNSLEILSQLWFANLTVDPNGYKEYLSESKPHVVEHLAALELKDSEYEIHTLEMPDRGDIEGAQSLLDSIFNSTLRHYVTENLNPEPSRPLNRLEEIRFQTIMHALVVRSPTYFDHWADILKGLFAADFVAEWMRETVGFDIEQALKCVDAINDLTSNKLDGRRKKGIDSAEELKKQVHEFKRTGRFTGPSDLKDTVNMIRNMRNKEASRAIRAVTVAWIFYELHDTCSFTSGEIAAQSGVPEPAAAAFLTLLSLRFGSTPKDYLIPNPVNPLKLRPIINYSNKFFSPATHLLIWSLKPRIEACLKPGRPDSTASSPRKWERYQKHRSNLLVLRGLEYFQKLLPRADAYRNLSYSFAESGTAKEPELDGLVLFDRYAFLVEGKAGELSFSAQRRGPLRLVENLKALVAEPHRQALRAAAHIASTDRPTFRTQDGKIITLRRELYSQFFLVTLTLEDLDLYTREISQLKDLGIFTSAELPWAISLNDLRIIAETISLPTQFTHYLKWRLYLNESRGVTAQSELDWLGYYLAEGPQLLEVPEGYDFLTLQTYTTAFDDFYLYEQGQRTIPAPRPAQFLPPELRSVLATLERINGYGYSAACEAILSLSFDERKQLAKVLQNFLKRTVRASGQKLEVRTSGATVILVRLGPDRHICNSIAESVANTHCKTAVVLSYGEVPSDALIAWGVQEFRGADSHGEAPALDNETY
ncbi:MAG: hypothetical protein WBQ34_15960 [Candidatus Acidiferrales bacterium]